MPARATVPRVLRDIPAWALLRYGARFFAEELGVRLCARFRHGRDARGEAGPATVVTARPALRLVPPGGRTIGSPPGAPVSAAASTRRR